MRPPAVSRPVAVCSVAYTASAHVRHVSPDRLATIVLATPSGLALEPWHGLLLGPLLSDRPLISLGELGRRGADGERAGWAGEGVRQQCFSKVRGDGCVSGWGGVGAAWAGGCVEAAGGRGLMWWGRQQ